MTTFGQFADRCKMRHDFGDQIQVRYQHPDGQNFDTWVSGTEALQRLEAIQTEKQIESLNRLSMDDLRVVVKSLPEAAKNLIRRSLRDEIANRLESGIGGNLIGDALSDSIRGHSPTIDPAISDKDRWPALMRYEPFRHIVLELAWSQLEGSFPDVDADQEPDDWL